MVELLVTRMEMAEAPSAFVPSPPPDAHVAREWLDRAAYLDLYRGVGGPVQWDQRLRMPAEALDALLADEGTHLYVLRADGEASGLCELVGVGGDAVELANFGLLPAAQGRGLGSYLLNTALLACWAFRPSRVWLKTDTNDHPAAVRTYEKAGFRVVEKRWEHFPD